MQIGLPTLDQPTGELGFWAGVVEVLARFVRGALLTEEEERRLHIAAFAGLRLGDPLLHAESVDDLDDRIDAAIQDPELGRLSAFGFRSAQGPGPSEGAAEHAIAPALADVFGAGALRRLEEGDVLATAIARATGQRWGRIERAAILQSPAPRDEPLAFLADPGVPAQVAEALLGGLKAAACLTAITQASLLRRRLQPWLALALAERWVEGQRAFLRLLASMPGVTVPEAILPAGERLDLERLLALASATKVRMGEMLAAAKGSGEKIYPPWSEPSSPSPRGGA